MQREVNFIHILVTNLTTRSRVLLKKLMVTQLVWRVLGLRMEDMASRYRPQVGDEMSGACSTHVGDEKYIKKFRRKTCCEDITRKT